MAARPDPHAGMNRLLALMAAHNDTTCASCNNSPPPGESLKMCARCRQSRYCNIDCQKAHWKQHKGNPCTFAAIKNNQFLETLKSRDEVYRYLIDMYRLRVEDDYKFLADPHGLYAGGDPVRDFRIFLARAERLTGRDEAKLAGSGNGEWNLNGKMRCGVLPSWWSPNTRKACERLAKNPEGNHFIGYAVEKPDIQEKYGDSLMPMKLRMVAEKIYGKSVSPF
ncbi:hypothetical protein LOZ52_002605 [Ophidiomyces ophidiicola]|nr:hypothetical protein LOZ64_000757 [Ophidiomyces ophidiicola]KAI2004945.1 hypothetical protein LOZ50_003984 [Ophidiomyces ophidiicola]KAI2013098.1 hypothetical protein LOZ49_002360 [Ophidiomyces ophidiicola]KAI2018501.1 hypothetical protein LOZ46_003849 [Ophidiomyces ophidiicola]KAI2054380.1 hypothetical protein LOZ44_002408 [Ophidiomyces ophidiicola]